jgi:hypothetical protein
MTRYEALLLAFPTEDIDVMIQAIDKAENDRKEFCMNLLSQAERLKIDTENAKNSNRKRTTKKYFKK